MSEEDNDSLRQRLLRRRRVIETTLDSDASWLEQSTSSGLQTTPGQSVAVDQADEIQQEDATNVQNVESVPSTSDLRNKKFEKLREKLRGRLQLAKQAAAKKRSILESPSKDGDTSGFKRHSLREDTSDVDDNVKVQERLKQRHLAREGAAGKDFLPNAEEAYDFFTRTWDEDVQMSPSSSAISPARATTHRGSQRSPGVREHDGSSASAEPVPSTSSQQPEELPASAEDEEQTEHQTGVPKVESETDENTKLLIHDLIPMRNGWQLYEYVPAQYCPFRERLDKEKDGYFVPSTTKVPIQEKLPEAVVPRRLADEGFYVGKQPWVKPSNRNKMEHRLIKNKELQWFGEDGEILAFPDAIDDCPSRPQFDELDEPPVKVEYRKAEIVDHLTDADIAGRYQLDINIGQVTFTHHPLFSREHVVASRLVALHRQYCTRQETSCVELLAKKLDVLRSAVASVREVARLTDGDDDPNAVSSREKRLLMYRREIRLLRQNLHREERADRVLLKSVLQSWKSLKATREKQRYVNTAVQLQISKKDVDREADLESWERAIEAEVEEEREDHELRQSDEMKEYKRKLKAYKRIRSKRKKRKESRTTKENEEEDLSVVEDSEELETAKKPTIPPQFDDVATRERIRQNALEIRRPPGEPMFYPELSYSATITPLELCPKREQKRRNAVSKCKLYAKIFYNEKEVTKTTAQSLTQDFTVTFGEIFNLCISHNPKSITLQLFESNGLSSNQLVETFLPIPSCSDGVSEHGRLTPHEFSSESAVTYSHEGVGSGISFNYDLDGENLPVTLLTSGYVHCSVSWAKEQDGRFLAPIETSRSHMPFFKNDPVGTLGAQNITDPEKLKQWLESCDLDPNDPANALFMQYVKDGFLSLTNKDYFRLEQLQEEFNFVQSNDFFEGRRFRLIQQRDRGVPEFRNYRMIPMRDRDIPADVFKAYEKRLQEDNQPPEQLDEDADSYRRKVAQYLHKVREEVWKRYLLMRRKKELADVVSEEQIPDIGALGSTLVHLAERKRPLRPIRKERKKVTAQNVGGAAVSILVNVANAFNVPVRKESERPSRFGVPRQMTTTSMVTIQEPLVRPLVEVTFQHATVRTTVSSGPNPCWNQDLQLEFKAPNEDFSPGNLQSVKDVLYFNLFDEVVVDLLEDERDRESLIHQRIEKRWLGSLQIPFSTLYLNTRVEGTFQITQQPILLGYTRDSKLGQADLMSVDFGSTAPLEKEHTYLSVFITLEPTLPLPEPLKEKFESLESEKLLERADAFRTSFLASFPKRLMKALVIDIQGKSVFVTRFLQPLAPPEELVEEGDVERTMTRVARFVALIPLVPDVAVFPGLCDIWTTNDQFLNMLVGDQEEHAVLLCNYFLFLKRKAWLLLGFAIPEGRTLYVLTEEGAELTMWNACTGEAFSVRDSFCPVQSVSCIIDQDNIWANVQHCSEPSRMSFDFKNGKHWRPFFDNGFRNPGLTSIQPEMIAYRKTEQAFVDKLAEKIERTLRSRIMQWRKRFRTSWNRHGSKVLGKILDKMESSKFGTFNEDEIQAELQTILSVYKMCGFPLSMPYTEMSAIWDVVYATGVHLTEGPNLEFALAVHVHPYPHNVVAVWIYVASLHKR